jgi:hypothetical protein
MSFCSRKQNEGDEEIEIVIEYAQSDKYDFNQTDLYSLQFQKRHNYPVLSDQAGKETNHR